MATKKTNTFETLIGNLTKATDALNAAKTELEGALSEVPVGHVVNVAGLPHHVMEQGGKRELRCMLTKRQIAAIRGEDVPPIKRRAKRGSKAEAKAEAAQEAE